MNFRILKKFIKKSNFRNIRCLIKSYSVALGTKHRDLKIIAKQYDFYSCLLKFCKNI